MIEGHVVVNSSGEVRVADSLDGAEVGARTLGDQSSGG